MDRRTRPSLTPAIAGGNRICDAVLAAPWTLVISAAAILAAMSSTATFHLELARSAIANGELWRLLTGHIAHFGVNHLAWDVAVFAALGAVCEARWPRRTRFAIIASALAISVAVFAFAPELETYRGLSGLDSAVFGLLATSLLCENRENCSPRGRVLTVSLGLLVAGFVAKIGYELFTATTFFVDSTAAGLVPVPLAHAVGFSVGMGIAWLAANQTIGTQGSVSYDGSSDKWPAMSDPC